MSKSTWVYFIYSQSADAVKIGFSNDPTRRLKDLQSASAVPLSLLHKFPGDRFTENDLHCRFADLRLEGEWFRFDDRIRKFIESLVAASANQVAYGIVQIGSVDQLDRCVDGKFGTGSDFGPESVRLDVDYAPFEYDEQIGQTAFQINLAIDNGSISADLSLHLTDEQLQHLAARIAQVLREREHSRPSADHLRNNGMAATFCGSLAAPVYALERNNG